MVDNIIWILLLFTILIILGLYLSEFTPIELSEKEKILKLNYITENFSPLVTTTTGQSEGTSQLYDWELPDDTNYNEPKKCEHKCDNKCETKCPKICDTPPPPPPIIKEPTCSTPVNSCSNSCNEKPTNLEHCRKCDITLNRDIDKYVLKSSVPSCPDMSEYITKNMMNSNPDLNDYILKSEIKPCEKVNLSKYILKSEIPPCPVCPVCPICPICPICPPEKKCKKIYDYEISDHPDIKDYISKKELKEKYILKTNDIYSEEEQNISTKTSSTSNSQTKFQQNTQKTDVLIDVYEENFKPPELIGYYAGDSLFAGV